MREMVTKESDSLNPVIVNFLEYLDGRNRNYDYVTMHNYYP